MDQVRYDNAIDDEAISADLKLHDGVMGIGDVIESNHVAERRNTSTTSF